MIVLKILAAPFVVALTLLVAIVSFLYCVASALCHIGCVVLTLLALVLFIGGQTLGGVVFLVLAFLVSPFGIPAIADWLMDRLYSLKYSLQDFITGGYFGTTCPKVRAAAGNSRRLSYRKEGCLRPQPISKSTRSAKGKPSPNP